MKRQAATITLFLVIELFLSFPGKESAFAGPITDRIVPFINQSNSLVDIWNRNAELADALTAAAQKALDEKALASLPILDSQLVNLSAKFMLDSNALSDLGATWSTECNSILNGSNSTPDVLSAKDACNEFQDSNNAAKDAQIAARLSLALATATLKSAADKAAVEIKVKQDADAKVATELKAKQEAETKVATAKAAALKKTTITCVKGKLTKKVTAVKPICPAGYKKK